MKSYCLVKTKLTWVAIIADEGEATHILLLDGPRSVATRRIRKDFPAARPDAKLLPRLQRELLAYFAGHAVEFSATHHLEGLTSFQRDVLTACGRIPPGKTLTYSELATRVGRPHAARAVGNALARNPLPLLIPCHRVVAGNRKLGGFSADAGVALKRKLLALEGAPAFAT